ncbi:hypothetical protein HN419_06160 [Candidatus Woesearchaeota archaeon]|jgi:hypothetical protein|nr:hypothetical protein [Candidatus Woesearchaeota archaeon]MBT3538080.1 hypothetical protein [Candidatus Woesearchaeota archaeon]MBT7105749.1 hypothetical protein [Candidatus Woesearchaeota archaeon]MBT7930756.1 hypothetical protein [Candidatus Woesearchaeota archaeon]
MRFVRVSDSVDDIVDPEFRKKLLEIAAREHAKAHKKTEHFDMFVEENRDKDGLGKEVDEGVDRSKDFESKHSDKYGDVGEALGNNVRVCCGCGWHKTAGELIGEEEKSEYTSSKESVGYSSSEESGYQADKSKYQN